MQKIKAEINLEPPISNPRNITQLSNYLRNLEVRLKSLTILEGLKEDGKVLTLKAS